MPRAITLLLSLLLTACAGLAVFQYLEIQERDQKIVSLTTALDEANGQRDLATKNVAVAKDELDKAREEASRAATATDEKTKGDAASGPAKPSNAPGEAAKDGNPMAAFAKMFKTEGKKMMKAQMSMAMRMTYGDLAKTLNLSPQDADLVMGLLGDRQMAMSEQSFALMDGTPLDDAKIAEVSAKSEALNQEYDGKLKATLGDAKFQQMKEYERSTGDRMTLTQADAQFTAAGAPLQGGQRDALMKIMSDTRKNSPPSIFDPNGKDMAKGLRALQDETSGERHIAQEKTYQQKVLTAATGVLNPDQINALQKSFDQSLEMQKFGIQMSKQMFKRAEPAAPAAK